MNSWTHKFLFATMLLSVLLAAFPGRAAAVCECGYADGRFTNYQGDPTPGIVIDGGMSDWSEVLADPDNNVCDVSDVSDVSDVYEVYDRDALDGAILTGRDITRFAYTWDSTHVQAYTERSGSTSNGMNFIYYADTDNDGYMEAGEPVIVAEWDGQTRKVTLSIGSYVQHSDGGDSLVDGDGHGDGYALPGTVRDLTEQDSGDWGSGDPERGIAMEWQIPWSVLGLLPGTPFTFHISSTNSSAGHPDLPSKIEDNVGGCGGGAASMQYADLTFEENPNQDLEAEPGEVIYGAHTISNLGNGEDTFNLSTSVTGDFTPAVRYFHDADKSGTFTDGDTLLTDTDGDGHPDTGPLAAASSGGTVNGTIDILIEYSIGAILGTASVVTTATSSFQPLVARSVIDIITVVKKPYLEIKKSVESVSDPVNQQTNPKSIPGAVMLYTIQVTNTGPGSVDADTVVITDPIPEHTALVLDFDGEGSGPVVFQDGSPASGLKFASGDVSFSNDEGATYDYTPGPPDAYGCDGTITHLKVNPRGVFSGSDSGDPSFQIQFKVRID